MELNAERKKEQRLGQNECRSRTRSKQRNMPAPPSSPLSHFFFLFFFFFSFFLVLTIFCSVPSVTGQKSLGSGNLGILSVGTRNEYSLCVNGPVVTQLEVTPSGTDLVFVPDVIKLYTSTEKQCATLSLLGIGKGETRSISFGFSGADAGRMQLDFSYSVTIQSKVGLCSGREFLTDNSGTVTDGPSNYPALATCEWLIQPEFPASRFEISFTSLDVQEDRDYVKIFKGPIDLADKQVFKLTGTSTPTENYIIKDASSILIQLTSDASLEYSGFSLK